MKYEVKHPSNDAIIVETAQPIEDLLKEGEEKESTHINVKIDGKEKQIGRWYVKNSEIKELSSENTETK